MFSMRTYKCGCISYTVNCCNKQRKTPYENNKNPVGYSKTQLLRNKSSVTYAKTVLSY